MRIATAVVLMALAGCRPKPGAADPTSTIAENAAAADGQRTAEQGENQYYLSDALVVQLGVDNVVIDGQELPIEGGQLADILKSSDHGSWRLIPNKEATGRDLIAAIRVGVEADFQYVELGDPDGLGGRTRVRTGYSKPGWPKMLFPQHGAIVEVAKKSVHVQRKGEREVELAFNEVGKYFSDYFEKNCDRADEDCNMIMAVDPTTLASEVAAVVSAIAVPVDVMLTSKADLPTTRTECTEPFEQGHLHDGEGTLKPELIQRTIRQGYSGFRRCYEQGLLRNTELQGMTIASLVIDTDGRISTVKFMPRPKRDQSPRPPGPGTTLPDDEVLKCMAKHYKTLQFPKPVGGKVVVVYPIQFSVD